MPASMGDHVKKKRLELGLTQKEAAKHLGVTSFTMTNWECGLRRPAIQHIPTICRFLGFDPEWQVADTLAERLVAKRRQLGLSQRAAAKKLGVDPSTWTAWEKGGISVSKTNRRLLVKFLDLSDGSSIP